MADQTLSTATRAPRAGRRVLGRSSVVLAGNAGYALAQFGVLVLLARQTSPAEVGRYALALAITAPVQLGLGLRLRTVRAVDASRTPFRTYLRLALVLATLAVVVATVAGLLAGRGASLVVVVGLVALCKGVESLIDVCYGEYQRQDRLIAIATSQLLRAGLTIGLVGVGARLGGLVGALVAMLLGWTLQLLVLDGPRIARSAEAAPGASPALPSGALVRRSWPLGLASAIASLSVALPRFVVAGLLDTAALGLFAVLSYPTTVVSLFANSVGQAQVRAMAEAARRGDLRGLRAVVGRTVAGTLLLGATGCAFVVLLGPGTVRRVLGPGYAADQPLLVVLVLVATASGLATNSYYLLVATGRYGSQPVVVVVTLLLALPVLYLATEAHGLVGTGLTLGGMYLLQALLTGVAAWRHLRRPVPALAHPVKEVLR